VLVAGDGGIVDAVEVANVVGSRDVLGLEVVLGTRREDDLRVCESRDIHPQCPAQTSSMCSRDLM
jgi:hypothetical protein